MKPKNQSHTERDKDSMEQEEFDVIISGAGPAGLTLAIELGQRGIRTLLLEKDSAPSPWPKMERSNARTMEIFARLGLDEQIREVGFPAEASMDIFVGTTLSEPAIVHLKFPTVAEYQEQIAHCHDGSEPAVPYQLVSQYALEPVLKASAENTPGVTVRFGCETLGFEQNDDGVEVTYADRDGLVSTIRGSYLVGCDGGTSMVRKSLGIHLEGEGRIRHQTQVQFRSEALYESIPMGKGRHYLLADGSTIVVQGNRTEFTLHSALPVDTDFEKIIRGLIGSDVDFEVLRVNGWNHNLLVAERYRDGRVFIAGDAAHLVIPNGGLGMNTAIGDVSNLAWLLSGTVQGWGGSGLLDAYEVERRPVALFNREASRWATSNLIEWKQTITTAVFERGEAGEKARRRLAEAAEEPTRRSYSMLGAELGYNYGTSALVIPEAKPKPAWEITRYTPSAQPGSRLPHVWLKDGRSISEAVGKNFTILNLRGESANTSLIHAFADRGATIDSLALDEPGIADLFQADFLLVRPDLHIVWRGTAAPTDPARLAAVATGHSNLVTAARSATPSSSTQRRASTEG
jgi:2-polyprenyl-6-methoxyphenol hydroxylase-like FAD-dependent oxidoreductase